MTIEVALCIAAFILGAVLGSAVGLLISSLCVIAHEADEHLEKQ